MKVRKIITLFYPSLLISLVIACLSLIDTSDISDMNWTFFPHFDKFVHFCMYFGLAITLSFDIFRHSEPQFSTLQFILIAWVLPITIGGLMELRQGYLTLTRSADTIDFIANTCGATSGAILGFVIIKPLFGRFKAK